MFLYRLVQINRSRRGFGFTLSSSCPVFIQTVDHDGDAARAGLRAGDHILEINGLNVRSVVNSYTVATHSSIHVIIFHKSAVLQNSQFYFHKVDKIVSGSSYKTLKL